MFLALFILQFVIASHIIITWQAHIKCIKQRININSLDVRLLMVLQYDILYHLQQNKGAQIEKNEEEEGGKDVISWGPKHN